MSPLREALVQLAILTRPHRLRTGKIARHQRIPRDGPLQYKEWEIPAGVDIPQPLHTPTSRPETSKPQLTTPVLASKCAANPS